MSRRSCVFCARSRFVKSPAISAWSIPAWAAGIFWYTRLMLMQIYESEGYSARDAAKLILEKPLRDRSTTAPIGSPILRWWMKARQYDKRLFTRQIEPNICAVQESNGLHVREYEGELLSLLDLPALLPSIWLIGSMTQKSMDQF